MKRANIRNSIGLFAFIALSACANNSTARYQAAGAEECAPTETQTCDRFAGENRNCTCERGDKLRDMVDAYDMPDY